MKKLLVMTLTVLALGAFASPTFADGNGRAANPGPDDRADGASSGASSAADDSGSQSNASGGRGKDGHGSQGKSDH